MINILQKFQMMIQVPEQVISWVTAGLSHEFVKFMKTKN